MARVEQGDRVATQQHLPFALDEMNRALPGGGLRLGALHEVAGGGSDILHGAAAALFITGCLARLPGSVLWVLEQADLFAPGLAAAGLDPDRVLYADAGEARTVLLLMEEGLRYPGLSGVVGEISGRLTLTASRRLQLAAERAGTLAFALRRPRRLNDPALGEPSAAVTRWRIAPHPSAPPVPCAPDVPGLARAWWKVDLLRCRGVNPGTWLVEACDATGHLGVLAELSHQPAIQPPRSATA
jgi:protein ImuA